MMDQNLYTPF